MIRYLAKQAVSSFIALFLFLTFMFFYAEIMIAHDYTVQFAMIYNRQQRQQIQEELGLNRPLEYVTTARAKGLPSYSTFPFCGRFLPSRSRDARGC